MTKEDFGTTTSSLKSEPATGDQSAEIAATVRKQPWTIHEGGAGYGYVRDQNGRPICAYGSAWILPSESQANARLIAAAPDMLAALEKIAGLDGTYGERAIEARVLARAAIAKAQGGGR